MRGRLPLHFQLFQGAGPVTEVEVAGDIQASVNGPQERFASVLSGAAHGSAASRTGGAAGAAAGR
ncbi:hypothetical protein ACWGE1_18290 [Streptomyces sp. NPDC054932]